MFNHKLKQNLDFVHFKVDLIIQHFVFYKTA